MTPYRDVPKVEALVVREPRVGVLVRLWRWLFGDPVQALKIAQCSAMHMVKYDQQRCVAVADPRCHGGNCTLHCNEHCHGSCRRAA